MAKKSNDLADPDYDGLVKARSNLIAGLANRTDLNCGTEHTIIPRMTAAQAKTTVSAIERLNIMIETWKKQA